MTREPYLPFQHLYPCVPALELFNTRSQKPKCVNKMSQTHHNADIEGGAQFGTEKADGPNAKPERSERQVRFKGEGSNSVSTPRGAPRKSQHRRQLGEEEDFLESDSRSYIDLHHKFIDNVEHGHFPKHMINKLESVGKAGLLDASAAAPPSKAYVVVCDQNCGTGDAWERRVVGVALSRGRANLKAMTTFCKKNYRHMLDPKTDNQKGVADPETFVGSPFKFVEDGYWGWGWRTTFKYFGEDNGGKECSAWGIDPEGCLGLLAVEGARRLSMVYVEVQDLFV